MAQQQQTVLRVQTNKPLSTYNIPEGQLNVATGTTMYITGSGTTTNPYSGLTISGSTFYGYDAYFDVVNNGGIISFQLIGMPYDPLYLYDPASIYLIRNGVEYLIRRTTSRNQTVFGEVNVLQGDIIHINNHYDESGIVFLYLTPNTSTSTVYETENLDLYTDIPIKINKSFAELQDIGKRNSDFSIGLSLPGSKKNNAFFESYFNVDVDTLYFNPLLRVPSSVLINDEVYFDGYLRLNKVSIINSKAEYDVTLFSNIGDLFGKIGNNLLKDLPYGNPIFGFNHIFNLGYIYNSWDDVGFNYDGNPNPYMYPITHNGYNYSGDTVNLSGATTLQQTRLYTTSSPLGSFPNEAAMYAAGVVPYRSNVTGTGLYDNQLKPALNVWSLIQLMFQTYGYTIKSDFMNTPWMKGLYMYGYFNSDTTKFSYKTPGTQTTLGLTDVEILIVEEYPVDTTEYCDGDPQIKTTRTYNIYVVKKGTNIPVYCTDTINVSLKFKLFKCDGPTGTDYSVPVNIPANSTGATYNWISNGYYPIQPGVSSGCGTCAFEYQQNFVGLTTSNVGISTLPFLSAPLPPNTTVFVEDEMYVDFNLIVNEQLKQIDFLSSIAKKFNLVFVPDPEVQNQIIIEPYQYYVGTGSIYDWTDKLSYDKGFSVQPALNFVESEIILTDLEDGDDGNKQFKDRNNRIYGQNFVFNQTDFKSQTKKIETIFSAQVTRKWDNNVSIPLGINYASSNSPEGSGSTEKVKWTYKGVKTKPKLFYYLGNKNAFIDALGEAYNSLYFYNTYSFKISSSDGVYFGSAVDAPVISNTMPLGNPDSNKINNDSICILFNSEEPTDVGVETFDGVNAYTDKDMYNLFYENRINNLYNPNTRFLSGYFWLKQSDIKNLKPKDIIKIKEQYFSWNKINGFNMTNPELTQVELVQIDNNPSVYPTRYFQYNYCADPATVYKIKTDFTNPQMNLTHFFISNWYDYNVGLLGGNVSEFTSSFRSDYDKFLPYTIYEITEDQYDNTGIIYTSDPNIYWDDAGIIEYSLKTYWVTTGQTGINLWQDCAGFNDTADEFSINVISPSGGTPTSIYHSGITLNITDTGWIKYNSSEYPGGTYQYMGSLGNIDLGGCVDCTSINYGFPFSDLAAFTIVDCGSACP